MKSRKIVVYNDKKVISQMVRDAIESFDGLNYRKEVVRFFNRYGKIKKGDTVIFATVEMKALKVNSNRIKLIVI